MSSALNSDFFSKEVILYTASGVVWTRGRQVKSYPWKQVLSLAEQLGLDIRRTGGSVVGEIRIKQLAEVEPVVEEDAPVEKAPAESMDKATRAKFIRGCNLIERFLDRETADLARYSMEMDAVVNWVMRLAELSDAPQATLSVADAWLDEMCPSVEPEAYRPPVRQVKFGCEHCGFMGTACDCWDDLVEDAELQALFDDEAFEQYIVAEDDGPVVDMGDCTPQSDEAYGFHMRTLGLTQAVRFIVYPRDGHTDFALTNGELVRVEGNPPAEFYAQASKMGFTGHSAGDYQPYTMRHVEREEAMASAAAEAHPEPVVIPTTPSESSDMVVMLTPTGVFDYRDTENLHVRSYPKGWHIGRLYARLMKRGWHVVEEDKYRGRIRHLTLSKPVAV